MKKEILDIFEILYNCTKYAKCGELNCDSCQAEILYKQGYRKVEKGGAVLTKEQNKLFLEYIKKQRQEELHNIISFIEEKDKKAGKYSIYSKLLEELKEKFGNEIPKSKSD